MHGKFFSTMNLFTLGVSLLILLEVRVNSQQQENQPCTLKDGASGRCVRLSSCPAIVLGLCASNENATDPLVCCDSLYEPEPKRAVLPTACGRFPPINHIAGGVEDDSEVHRWSVFLDLGNGGRDRCVGSVITDRHVLTAAHCLDNKQLDDITMYFGIYDLRVMEECLQDKSCQKRKPSKFIIHEMYDSDQKKNNIALIRFNQPLIMTEFIEPICLPLSVTYGESFPHKAEQRTMLLHSFGWGEIGGGVLSDTRRVVLLNVTTQGDCENSKTMCTIGLLSEYDLCKGDSGAPLVWLYKKRMYVVGVVSHGSQCRNVGSPSVAVRISGYMDWILKNLSI